jgi:tripartite-type tricarboxylate transporter receptor subunit TctC
MHLISRRPFLTGAVSCGAGMLLGGCSQSDPRNFPERDINFIIPFAPGGGFDAYVRVAMAPMAAALPHKVNLVPMNVDGAGGGKAASQLYHARPDGYTISILNVPGAIVLQLVQGGGGYDLSKMSWLGNMGRDPYGVAVGYNSPIRSFADLQAISRKRPVKFTSTGPGSTGRAATLISSKMLDIHSQIIAGYKGTSEYLVAAARGDGDAAVCSLTAMSGLVRAKVIRIIATFEAHSSVPGAESATSLGQPDLTKIVQMRPVAAPPHLPREIQTTLANSLRDALRSPSVVAWAKKNGANLAPETPEETLAALHEQIAFITKWRDVLGSQNG